MSQHIPPALLQKFISGDLEEPVAVAVALHIDHCSRCHAAAATADPLSQDFAAVDDPDVPEELLASLQQAATVPQQESENPQRRRSNAAIWLMAAGALLAFFVYPESLQTDSQAQLTDTYGAASEGFPGQLVVGVSIGLVVGAYLSFRGLKHRRKAPKTKP